MDTSNQSLALFVTSSVQVRSSRGSISGIFCSIASGSPTIKVWNNTSATGTVLIETFTPVAGTMYDFGKDLIATNGIFVTIGGTVSCTVFYN